MRVEHIIGSDSSSIRFWLAEVYVVFSPFPPSYLSKYTQSLQILLFS